MIKDIPKNSPFISPIKSYQHQAQIVEGTWNLPHYGLLWEMGTGKSKVIVETAMRLFYGGEIDGVLIMSDKGAYRNWLPEFQVHAGNHPIRYAVWSAAMSHEERILLERVKIAQDDVLDVLIMNIESMSTDRGKQCGQQFLQSHHAMWVIDESSSIKNPQAQRTKGVLKLAPLAEYRRILNGTPVTQSPLDLYSQCQFLQPGVLGHNSYFSFRANYAVMVNIQAGNRSFPKIVGYQNLEDLSRRLQAFTSRLTKADCLDLPPKVYETYEVELTPEQRRAYDELKRQCLTEIDGGLVTATMAITAMTKMHRILCGHIETDEGRVVDIPQCRVAALLEVLEKIQGKAIIWCRFQRDVEIVRDALIEAHGAWSTVTYYGPTSQEARQDAIEAFQSPNMPDCRFFVGTPHTGGKGINLTAASTVVYYSNDFSLEKRLQSEDRAHRIGQTGKVTYVDLVAPGTLDQRVLEALKKKRDVASLVIDDLRQMLAI